MSTSLLQNPSYVSPRTTLQISQQAPAFLKTQTGSSLSLPYPLSLLVTAETPEKWAAYENLLLACLKTGDDESAYVCLEGLRNRFGPDNERVQALRGLYQEATAADDQALQDVLTQYEETLKEKPTNMPIRKRRVALLRSMGRTSEAVKALTELLDASPIDAEAWSELADLYLAQGLYSQTIFCLEEVLLITANAWNIHARVGETLVLSANAKEAVGDQMKLLSEAMRRFCRSIELCNDYLRGYYGLKLTTSRLLQALEKTTKPASASSDIAGDLAPPPVAAVKKLNELATRKLGEILRRTKAKEAGWEGYDEAELIAARELVDRDTQSVQR